MPQHVAEHAVVGQELRQLLAQHEERLVAVGDVDDDVVDVVAALADRARSRGCTPEFAFVSHTQRCISG